MRTALVLGGPLGVVALVVACSTAGVIKPGPDGGTSGGGTTGTGGAGGHDAGPVIPRVFGGFFPLGVWYQPAPSMSKWAMRGVNTAVWSPADQIDAFDAATLAAGLKTIRLPRGDGTADVGNANLFAWAQPDEPDLKMYSFPFSQLQTTYTALKNLAPEKPVYVNFGGENVSSHFCYFDGPGDGGPPPAAVTNCYNGVTEDMVPPADPSVHYMTTGDILALDIYPSNSYDGSKTSMPITIVGQTLDVMARMQKDEGLDKPQMAFIETSNQRDLFWARAPTTDELRGEIWDAILHGARGVVYFPNVVPDNNFFDPPANTITNAAYSAAHDPQMPCEAGDFEDGTPCAVVAEMTTQDALITGLASVLQGPIDPAPVTVAASAPFEVGWRVEADATYVFVLNAAAQPSAALSLPVGGLGSAKSATVSNQAGRAAMWAGGTLGDTAFSAYEVRVYKLQ